MAQQLLDIWVLDDDESVRRSLSRLLRAAGFRCETFASAKELLGRDDRKSCPCLVLDVRMPGMDGLELQQTLITSGNSIPVVFITAHDDPDTERQAMQSGAVAFLHKPFDDQTLLDAVAAALASRPPASDSASPGLT